MMIDGSAWERLKGKNLRVSYVGDKGEGRVIYGKLMGLDSNFIFLENDGVVNGINKNNVVRFKQIEWGGKNNNTGRTKKSIGEKVNK